MARWFWALSQALRSGLEYDPRRARVILATILKHGSPLLQRRARDLIGDHCEPSRNPAEQATDPA
jgi:hypothetical protein